MSLSTGDGYGPYGSRAGFLKGIGAGIERRTRRHHIIDEKYRAFANPFGTNDGKRAGHVFTAFLRVEMRLRFRLTGPDKGKVVETPVQPLCQLFRKQGRLVVRTFTQTEGMQRYRQDDIDFLRRKMSRNAAFQKVGKVGGKPSRPAIFQLVDKVAQFERETPGGACLVERRGHG